MGSLRDLLGELDEDFAQQDKILQAEMEGLSDTQMKIYERIIADTFHFTTQAMAFVSLPDYLVGAEMAHRHAGLMFSQAREHVARVERERARVLMAEADPDYGPGVGPHVVGQGGEGTVPA